MGTCMNRNRLSHDLIAKVADILSINMCLLCISIRYYHYHIWHSCWNLTRDSNAPNYVFFESRMQKLWGCQVLWVLEPKLTGTWVDAKVADILSINMCLLCILGTIIII